jgi:hypothetical protein
MGRRRPPAPTHLDARLLIEATGEDSLRTVARRLGVDPSLLCRPLSVNQADRYATKLGLHPAEVWGDTWWAAA